MTLGRSIYYIYYYFIYPSSHDSPFFTYLSGQEVSRVRMRRVTTMGVDWTSEEVSDLVEPLLNLVMYMHLRIFTYTSNTLIVSFE